MTGLQEISSLAEEMDKLYFCFSIRPWLLVEVKSSGRAGLSRHLEMFQEKTGARHALQVAIDLDYIEADCFSAKRPLIVPAKTFLSQLV
ncbi:hypothetical protein [Desulfomarina sp.]